MTEMLGKDNELNDLRKQLEDTSRNTQDKVSGLEDEISRLKELLASTEEKNENLMKKVADLSAEKNDLQHQLIDLQGQLKVMAAELNAHADGGTSLASEIDDLKMKLAGVQEELKSRDRELGDEKKENEKVGKELAELQKQLNAAEQANQFMEGNLTSERQNMKELREEIAEAKAQLLGDKVKVARADDQQGMIKRLEKAEIDLKKALEEANFKIESLENELEEMRKEKDDSISEISENMKGENNLITAALQKELQGAQKLRDEALEEKNQADKAVIIIGKELDASKDALKALEGEFNELSDKFEDKLQQIRLLTDENTRNLDRANQLRGKNDDLERLLEEAHGKLITVKKELNKVTEDHRPCAAEIARLQGLVEHEQDKNTKLTQEIETAGGMSAALVKELEAAELVKRDAIKTATAERAKLEAMAKIEKDAADQKDLAESEAIDRAKAERDAKSKADDEIAAARAKAWAEAEANATEDARRRDEAKANQRADAEVTVKVEAEARAKAKEDVEAADARGKLSATAEGKTHETIMATKEYHDPSPIKKVRGQEQSLSSDFVDWVKNQSSTDTSRLDKAAIEIQRIARGHLARKRIGRKLKEIPVIHAIIFPPTFYVRFYHVGRI